MSFWTRIGLPDKKMFSELQAELALMREQNQRIEKQNEALCQTVSEGRERLKEIIERQIEEAKKTAELDVLRTELGEVGENLENLWEIMKVVFVDSVLTELDKTL